MYFPTIKREDHLKTKDFTSIKFDPFITSYQLFPYLSLFHSNAIEV